MKCNVLIIGSGLAGLTTAIYLSQHFSEIVLVTKAKNLWESNTYYAQGGVVYKGEVDSPDTLAKDIIYAGAGLCYEPNVRRLVEEGPGVIDELLIREAQIKFDLTDENTPHLSGEGAHSVKRVIHSGDSTGMSIMEGLVKLVANHPNIHVLTDYTALDIITREHHSDDLMSIYKKPECLGAYFYHNVQRTTIKILAHVTVLATGGIGKIYQYTSNPDIATGDGLAMAHRAGCQLINMPYTQFHPTTFYHKNAPRTLITEAVRGEGGILRDLHGEAFMKKYHPMGDLAPRDVVTRGILDEMMKEDLTHVSLDITHLGAEKINKRFPQINKFCLSYGIDPSQEPIPVIPAYHFLCGGIKVNEWSKTLIKRLFAVGECACTGIHGANRLASTSLLECLVFGKRTAQYIKENWNTYERIDPCSIPEWIEQKGNDVDIALIIQDWNNLRSTMWNYLGPIRNHSRLRRAMSDLRKLQENIEDFYREFRLNQNLIELRNGVKVGMIIAQAAWITRTNRGCHYRIK